MQNGFEKLHDESLIRPRRLRHSARVRELVRETRVDPGMLMQPFFIVGGRDRQNPIKTLPGVFQYSCDRLVPAVDRAIQAGVKQVLLFGVLDAEQKDRDGASACSRDNPVYQAVRILREFFGEKLLIATDVCLCGTLTHGHCGIEREGRIDNDASLAPLAAMAVAHAEAGADIVAPSDMMDGRVRAIRRALDAQGFKHVALMSYSVKYASSYYGPFREAANNTPETGDRKSYQMDFHNRREALREAELDVHEGADILMVKPALAYLDVVADLRRGTDLPLAAYNVSGEYALVKAGSELGFIDEGRMVRENLTAMVRAGATILITYHATEALERGWLDPSHAG